MIGLSFLALLGLFVTVLHFVKKWLFGHFDNKLNSLPKRLVASVVFWVLVFTLPVADEIVGGFQFRALCKEGAQLKINAEIIKEKLVRVRYEPTDLYLSGTAIPIRYTHHSYHDVETNEEYASFNSYVAEGGLLMRSIRSIAIPVYNKPLTFSFSSCSPPRYGELDKKYQFKRVN
jgi:hypothetical protein